MNPGFVLWLTGIPASGKTTIAKLLLRHLNERHVFPAHLESDVLRKLLTPAATYSRSERDWFYSVVRFFAQMLSDHGVNVVLDATANQRKYRDALRNTARGFVEVYVRCPVEVCVARDPKGIYASVREGKASMVPGIQDPYEEPEHPEILIDSDRTPPEAIVQEILHYLETHGWIPSRNKD